MTNMASRRRKERAHVFQRLRGVFVDCPEVSPHELRIVNISELGVGIETSLIKQPPEVGKVMSGKLVVGYTVAEIQIKLAHYTPIIAGFEFVELPEAIRNAIRLYFEPEIVGASLKPQKTSTGSLKYKDAHSNGLEVSISSENELKSFVITVQGNEVRWSTTEEVHMIQNETRLPVPEYLRKQLVSLIQSAELVDPTFRKMIENILRFLPVNSP